MSDQTKAADSAVKPAQKATGQSTYDKDKAAEQLINTWDAGTRKRIFNRLLADWSKKLPQKAKEYGVNTASGSQWENRLEWLQEKFGKPFKAKGTDSIRRMSLSSVLELLVLFTLKAADSTEENPSFGVLDDGSPLAEAVVPKLREMKDAVGSKLEISQSTVKQLAQLATGIEAMPSEEAKKKILDIIQQITG